MGQWYSVHYLDHTLALCDSAIFLLDFGEGTYILILKVGSPANDDMMIVLDDVMMDSTFHQNLVPSHTPVGSLRCHLDQAVILDWYKWHWQLRLPLHTSNHSLIAKHC